MIGNHSKGKDPYKLVQYLITKPQAQVLTSNLGSTHPVTIAQELQWSSQLNSRTRRLMYHVSLSLAPRERLTDRDWRQLARDYLKAMGFDACPYLVVRHHDRPHDHIHLAVGRVRLDNSKCVSDGWDHLRCQTVLRELEQRYGLQPTPSSWEHDRGAAIGVMQVHDQTEQALVKQKLQAQIDESCEHCSTLDELIESLHEQSIEVTVGRTRAGFPTIAYQMDNVTFNGSQLGRAYTVHGLGKYRHISSSAAVDAEQDAPDADDTQQKQWVERLLPVLQRLVQDSHYCVDENNAWVDPYWIECTPDQVSVDATDGRGVILQVKFNPQAAIQSVNLTLGDVEQLQQVDESSAILVYRRRARSRHSQKQLEL